MHRKSSLPNREINQTTKCRSKISQFKKRTETCDNDEVLQEIAMIEKILEQTPDIRKEKVAALRKAIKSGSYAIHSKKIAEQMIKESLFDLYLQVRDKR
jgi:flagellar biosynthesis anti-sigma factor FlgM